MKLEMRSSPAVRRSEVLQSRAEIIGGFWSEEWKAYVPLRQEAIQRGIVDPKVPLSPELVVGKKVLEVGCGPFSQMPTEGAADLTCIDISQYALEVARAQHRLLRLGGQIPKGTRCTYKVGDAYDLRFKDGRFYSAGSFRVWSTLGPDFDEAAKEMARVARHGVMFTFLSMDWWRRNGGGVGREHRYCFTIHGEDKNDYDQVAATPMQLASLVDDLGLTRRRMDIFGNGWIYVEAQK